MLIKTKLMSHHDPFKIFDALERCFGPSSLWAVNDYDRDVNVTTTEESSAWTIDLPGVDREDVEVTVSREREVRAVASRGKKKLSFIHVVPSGYDIDAATAKLEKGVLMVVFPRAAASKSLRKIEVK